MVNSIIKRHLPSIPSLLEGKKREGLDLWVPRKLTPSQINDDSSPTQTVLGGCSLDSNHGAGPAAIVSSLRLPVGSALCSLDS